MVFIYKCGMLLYIYIYIHTHTPIVPYVKTNKKRIHVCKQEAITSLSSKPLKSVAKFTYLSSNINIQTGKTKVPMV